MPFDPTITQKVRTQLIEDGHSDLVVEQLSAAFGAVEGRLEVLERDVRLLQIAETRRVTDSGVHKAIVEHANKDAVNWLRWGIRAALIGAGGLVARLAWKGMHAP